MKIQLLLALSLLWFFVGCQKDQSSENNAEGIPYEVDIDITSPGKNEIAVRDEFIHLHVVFSHHHHEPIQYVYIELLNSRGELVESLFDEAVREPSGIYTYHYMGYAPTEAGDFVLRASTADQNQEHKQSVSRTFTVE